MSDVSALQHYVVEIDGVKHSEHAYFVEAIKDALLLHEQNPESKIVVCDLFQSKSEEVVPGLAA